MKRIVSEKAKLNEKELPPPKMPNRDGFVPIPVGTRLRVRLNTLAGFMLCGKTIRKTHKREIWRRGGIRTRVGGFSPQNGLANG